METVNLLTHLGQLITPQENAVQFITALRTIIDDPNNETSSAKALLDKTSSLLGDQRVAINAHAELTSFVLAEQMKDNLKTDVATLNTTITTLNDTNKDKINVLVQAVNQLLDLSAVTDQFGNPVEVFDPANLPNNNDPIAQIV